MTMSGARSVRLCDARHASVLMTKLAAVAMMTLICGVQLPATVNGQIAYTRHLSDLRIRELHNIADLMRESVKGDHVECDNYYDHVCSRNRPMYSVLGNLPEYREHIQLYGELQEDSVNFEAKQKLMDFFTSCNTRKLLEDCYYETFEYFKPLYGYIITKNYIDRSSHEHHELLGLLQRFLKKAETTENFSHNPIRLRLASLMDKFRNPDKYFSVADLNHEYNDLRVYRDSYKHNIRNLEQHRKRNSTYDWGVAATMLNWSLYLFQGRSKPMSYYYATFNVHLWMSLYNNTEHQHDAQYFNHISECLKLPQFVNVLGEARILAVVYLKSFRNAWQEYRDWILMEPINQEIYNHENQILKPYKLNNKQLFFTMYGQNFCDFGRELAEHVFYLGMKYNQDFYNIYSCGFQTTTSNGCV